MAETTVKATVRQMGRVSVVDVSGRITIGEGDRVLSETLQELLENGRWRILLNLSEVPYMDSSGIGELIAGYKHAKEKNGSLKLLNPSDRVNELLRLTRLQEVFETFRDEQEAIGSF